MSHANIAARLRARLSYSTGKTNEDQELAQGSQGSPPRQPVGSSQGSRIHHQQDRAALQSPPRLSERAGLLGHHAKFSLTITIAGLVFRNAESLRPCSTDSRRR